MASQSNLTLATRVFTPAGVQNGLATWRYVEDAVFKSTSKVTQSVRGPSKDGVYRIEFKLDTPRALDVDSACGCAGTVVDKAMTRIETIYPASWTKAQRQEHADRIQSLVAGAVFTASHDDLEGSW